MDLGRFLEVRVFSFYYCSRKGACTGLVNFYLVNVEGLQENGSSQGNLFLLFLLRETFLMFFFHRHKSIKCLEISLVQQMCEADERFLVYLPLQSPL